MAQVEVQNGEFLVLVLVGGDVAALTSTVASVDPLDGGPLRVGSQARLKHPGQRPTVLDRCHT